MSSVDVVTRRHLPPVLTGPRAPVWWAMMILVVIETTVFATLLSSYFYIRFSSPEWPQDGIEIPGLLMPAINTAVLFASSVAVFIGGRAIKKGNVRGLKIWLGAGVLLEAVFLGGKLFETGMFDYTWSTNAYGSIFWSISGLHSVHVGLAILLAGAVEILALRGYFTKERRLGIQVASIYWQFVAIIWIPVLIVLYFVPRWW